jgi:hypothetical protein
MVPDIVNKFTSKKEKMPSDKEAVKAAFPDKAEE